MIIIFWGIYEWKNPNYVECFKENSEEFAENRIHFEKIITNIKLRYTDQSRISNLEELSKVISKQYYKQLNEIGIENIELSFEDELMCSEKMIYKFNVKTGYNIKTLNVVQIIYSPCDKRTKKGYHTNSHNIDVNGEGNNWIIFSDTDFI